MFKIYLLLIFLCFNAVQAQNTLPITNTINNAQFNYKELDSIAKVLGLRPGENVRVSVKFAVNEQGYIVDIKTKGPHGYFDEEAKKLLRKVPKLQPAIINNKPVKTQFSMPIIFHIETKKERKRRLKKEKIQQSNKYQNR